MDPKVLMNYLNLRMLVELQYVENSVLLKSVVLSITVYCTSCHGPLIADLNDLCTF